MSQQQPEAWVGALKGLDLSHDLTFGVRDLEAVSRIAGMIGGAGAQLEMLTLRRGGDGLAARCRLKGISPESARELLGALASEGAVEAPLSIEHLMLARGDRS